MMPKAKVEEFFNNLKERLTNEVMNEVGKRLTEETKENQEKFNALLSSRIDDFEKNMRQTAKEIVLEELKNKQNEEVEEVNKVSD